jgi:hypothetical protein
LSNLTRRRQEMGHIGWASEVFNARAGYRQHEALMRYGTSGTSNGCGR